MPGQLERFQENVRALCSIALARLPEMIDPASGLVVFRLRGEALKREGTSLRYTAITALGLERAEAHGLSTTVDRGALLEALDATLAGADDAGALGLTLWAAARDHRALAERALAALLEHDDVRKIRGGDTVHSTELAWVAIGLAEALAAGVGRENEVRARLDGAFARLLSHRGESGLVGFARPIDLGRSTLRSRARQRLGFFDAQVYAIVAALRKHEVTGDAEALEAARSIGSLLLQGQGRRGQWAWHYDTKTGDVVDLYPVYSVHQDGMAPLALLPLEKATGIPATAAVARGVSWLFDDNEIGEPLAHPDAGVIWRSVKRRGALRALVYPLKLASLSGLHLDLGARLGRPSCLSIDRELRPYHLGFCLLAFAELAGRAQPTLRTGVASTPEPRRSTNHLEHR